jgi:hypothetical protein
MLLLCALAACVMGAAIYLESRPHSPVMLEALGLQSGRLPLSRYVQWITDSLPSLLHVYSFSLFSLLLLERRTERAGVGVVLIWVVINLLFEMGQASTLKSFWSGYAVDGSANNAFVHFFLHGTFDLKDVVFSFCGGVMAYLTMIGGRS